MIPHKPRKIPNYVIEAVKTRIPELLDELMTHPDNCCALCTLHGPHGPIHMFITDDRMGQILMDRIRGEDVTSQPGALPRVEILKPS